MIAVDDELFGRQRAFDPGYDTMPLSAFEPMLRRLFARTPRVGLPLLAAAE